MIGVTCPSTAYDDAIVTPTEVWACLDKKEGYANVGLEYPDGRMRAFEIKVDLAPARSDSTVLCEPAIWIEMFYFGDYAYRALRSALCFLTILSSIIPALGAAFPTASFRALKCIFFVHFLRDALSRATKVIVGVTSANKYLRRSSSQGYSDFVLFGRH